MPGNAGYTIGRKEEFRKMVQTGDVETWWRIYATTPKGTYFHVELPDRDLAQAPQLLENKARQLDAI